MRVLEKIQEYFSGAEGRDRRLAAGLALAALAVRLGYVFWTRGAAPHPDLGSFLPSSLPFSHPFDTSPREPLFVWWLWLLGKLGAGSVTGIRLAGCLWSVPALLLLRELAAPFLGRRWALAACALYAFLPAQVQSDALGLRHVIETPAVLLLCLAAWRDGRNPRRAAAALALLALTRVSYAFSGTLVLAAQAIRARSARPLLALLALLPLLPHFADNKARHGEYLYSVTLHGRYIANMENLGRPGFPATVEEWQKDPYAERLTARQWLFENHTSYELARDSLLGLLNGVWNFYFKVYYSLGLPLRVEIVLLGLYLLGLGVAALTPGQRLPPLWLLLLTLPYAFTSHVFWAGRFFMPFAPLGLMSTVFGARSAACGLLPLGRRLLSRLPRPAGAAARGD